MSHGKIKGKKQNQKYVIRNMNKRDYFNDEFKKNFFTFFLTSDIRKIIKHWIEKKIPFFFPFF